MIGVLRTEIYSWETSMIFLARAAGRRSLTRRSCLKLSLRISERVPKSQRPMDGVEE